MRRKQEMVGDVQPVSPSSQCFITPELALCIIAAFEMETPFDDSKGLELVEKLFLPINTRFSSILIRDVKGLQHWKKVNINLEDHVISPCFPNDLSPESYEQRIQDYISNLSLNPLPENKPLWEIHNIKYPTTKCLGTLVFKLHHSLGDGFSLMGALFSSLGRADNPSLPLTFPAATSRKKTMHANRKPTPTAAVYGKISCFLSTSVNTARDFFSGLVKSSFAPDETSPIRSGVIGIEFLPVQISTLTFPLDSIRLIKAKIGGTVNDVIASIIFYGTRLYIKKMSGEEGSDQSDVTALVLLNTRAIKTYQTLDQLNKSKNSNNNNNDDDSKWGNQFGFLHISIPKFEDQEPLDFVFKTKDLIRTKRNSRAVYLIGGLLEMLRRMKGPEAVGRYIADTLRNTSFTISNLIGPLEKMGIGGNPVKSFYFSVVGTPQSLSCSAVSYMGNLKLCVSVEKGFVNSELLMSCMDDAFTKIFQQATSSS